MSRARQHATDPGGYMAIQAGCLCPQDQPGAHDEPARWACDEECPLHGVAVSQAVMEESGLVDEHGGGPKRVA